MLRTRIKLKGKKEKINVHEERYHAPNVAILFRNIFDPYNEGLFVTLLVFFFRVK